MYDIKFEIKDLNVSAKGRERNIRGSFGNICQRLMNLTEMAFASSKVRIASENNGRIYSTIKLQTCVNKRPVAHAENMKTVGPGPTNIRPNRQVFKLVGLTDR